MAESAGGNRAHELQALLRSRATVQDFSSAALPEGALRRALEAAISAPNHRMTEPWRFIRVGPETRERLAHVQARLKEKGSSPSAEALERARKKVLGPAELLVVARVVHPDAGVAREDYAAVACAVQNLFLSLWAEGIGSKWGTGGICSDAETYALLGLAPEHSEIVGFLWLGFAAEGKTPKKPPRRLSVEQVLSDLP